MRYAALIFDIVESRYYNDRYDVQRVLMESVGYLNHIYRDTIKKSVVPSAGDEFQGLFNNLQSAFIYIRKLQFLLYPIKIRCGIGYGEIKYDHSEWGSVAFDGEAYYRARDAINTIPKRKGNIICFNTGSKYDKYLNTLCAANTEIKSRQSQMVRWIELLADIIMPLKPTREDIRFYHIILESRTRILEEEKWNIVIDKTRELTFFNTDFNFLLELNASYEFNNRYIDNDKYMDGLQVEDFWAHGMTTDIAEAMHTSRQNIDRYVVLGKIKESRTIDKAIFEFIGEEIW